MTDDWRSGWITPIENPWQAAKNDLVRQGPPSGPSIAASQGPATLTVAQVAALEAMAQQAQNAQGQARAAQLAVGSQQYLEYIQQMLGQSPYTAPNPYGVTLTYAINTVKPAQAIPRGLTQSPSVTFLAACYHCDARGEATCRSSQIPSVGYALPEGWEVVKWNIPVLATIAEMMDGSTQMVGPPGTETILILRCPACVLKHRPPIELPPPDFFPVPRGRVVEIAVTPEEKLLATLLDPNLDEALDPMPAPEYEIKPPKRRRRQKTSI